jgi:hypothetical protein
LDGKGTLSLGAEDSSFTDNRKLVLSLTSPLPRRYPPALMTITAHLKPDPVSPLFSRAYTIPKPSPEEGELVPKKPVSHTTAAITRSDLAIHAVANATWASIGRSPKVTQPTYMNVVTDQHMTIIGY